jgi:hypothetical protein
VPRVRTSASALIHGEFSVFGSYHRIPLAMPDKNKKRTCWQGIFSANRSPDVGTNAAASS